MATFNVLMQFILHTGGIVLLMILMQPIIEIVAYENPLAETLSVERQATRDLLYQWSLIIGVVAMGGNVLWMYRALQRKTTDVDAI